MTKDVVMSRPLRAVLLPPAVAFLVVTLMLGNLGQMMSIVVRPLSKHAFRRINAWIAGTWWSTCVATAAWLHGTRIVLTGDKLPYGEDAIVIVNHQDMPDITFLMELAKRHGRLGDMKWIVKDVLKWVPGVGWGMVFLECVFVRREWMNDKQKIEQAFASLAAGRVPVWFLSFPEGTRFTLEKLTKAQVYAKAREITPPKHVLLPRDKGFIATVRGLRGHVKALYDVTIGYPKGVPTMWQYVKGAAPGTIARLHVTRYPIEALPEDDEALSRWLTARFCEKDNLLDYFHRTGGFPSGGSTR